MTIPTREYDRGVNSEIERLLYQTEVVVMDGRGLAADLTEQQFNWAPGDGKWTVGQCLEHLNITHKKWLPDIEQAVKLARENGITGSGPYTYGYFSRLFLRILEPPVKRLKAGAPASFQPEKQLDRDEVVGRYLDHHERLTKILEDADGLNLSKVKVRSAFSNMIKYQLGMAFWIILAHDRRHIWQARQVCIDKQFPK
jgi:DinB family protein